MKRMIAGLVLALAVAMPASAQEIIMEDDPRWDCRTMGNHTCGDTLYVEIGQGLFVTVPA